MHGGSQTPCEQRGGGGHALCSVFLHCAGCLLRAGWTALQVDRCSQTIGTFSTRSERGDEFPSLEWSAITSAPSEESIGASACASFPPSAICVRHKKCPFPVVSFKSIKATQVAERVDPMLRQLYVTALKNNLHHLFPPCLLSLCFSESVLCECPLVAACLPLLFLPLCCSFQTIVTDRFLQV